MKLKTLLLPSVALGAAAMLIGPAPTSDGFSTIGGNLSTGQRDFRIFNNFTDSSANDNVTPDTQFPGHQGAVMAIWKACVEWGSELHGNGNGDPSQLGGLGSGGANFDAFFSGESTGVGSSNNNIHSEISGSSGGVLAYCETPISDGWRIRYYQGWTWADGPFIPTGSQMDLQGIACHEYGHALGLGHSTSGSATMTSFASGSGYSQRSIASDDINGVQFIYGSKSSTKPVITNATFSSGTVTITGSDFSTSGNEVWFTNNINTGTGVDPVVRVFGVSSTGGGTTITTAVPAGAGPGDVAVKKNASGHSSLSNAWPVDLVSGPGGGSLGITSFTPSVIDALNVGTDKIVTINGTGFSPTTTVSVNGTPLSGIPSPVQYINSTTLLMDPPNAPFLGNVTVEVNDGPDSDSATITYVANSTPAIQGNTGDEPVTFFTFAGLNVTCAADPGDIFVVLASTSNAPSIVPGWFNLGIGNGLSQIFVVAQPAIGANGLAEFLLPTTMPPQTTFYMQGVAVDPFLTLPLPESNVQECQSIF